MNQTLLSLQGESLEIMLTVILTRSVFKVSEASFTNPFTQLMMNFYFKHFVRFKNECTFEFAKLTKEATSASLINMSV